MPKIVDKQMREATRHRILHEAANEFARLGFDQANINVIAEQAAIGKGTIYLYFENKRATVPVDAAQWSARAAGWRLPGLAAVGMFRQRLERLFRAFATLRRNRATASMCT